MNKTYKRIIILVTLLSLLLLYLLNSNLIINEFINYTNLFITKLLPVTFIFFICTSLLLDYGIIELLNKLFRVNTTTFYIILISLISGFPSGSKYIKDLYQKNLISIETANKLLMCTHFPNPLFILGTVNSIINNQILTTNILISIILSNIILLIINKPKNKNKINTTYTPPISLATSLSNAIFKTSKIILIIYGNSIFFYLIATIINKYLNLNIYSFIILNGLFDLTKGISSTSLLSNNIIQSLYIITFISFGGISIHMQVKSILSDTHINYNYFLIGRLLGTIISLLIFIILINLPYFRLLTMVNS